VPLYNDQAIVSEGHTQGPYMVKGGSNSYSLSVLHGESPKSQLP